MNLNVKQPPLPLPPEKNKTPLDQILNPIHIFYHKSKVNNLSQNKYTIYMKIKTITRKAERCGLDLVSSWHCWLTADMANGLSTVCGPALAMTA